MILIITYILNLFDLVCTMLWVNELGTDIEANPIGKWMIQSGGVYFVKIVVIGLILYILYLITKAKPKLKWVCWIPMVAYSLLAIYHIIILGLLFS